MSGLPHPGGPKAPPSMVPVVVDPWTLPTGPHMVPAGSSFLIDKPLNAEGLKVALKPIQGVTPSGLLGGKAGIVLQCPPLDAFAVSYAHSHNDYETLSAQQSRKGVPQLATIQFQTLAVDVASYAVNQDAPSPEAMTARLRALCLSGEPFLLDAYHTHHGHTPELPGGSEWRGYVTLRQFTATEKAGEGDARYLDVAFTEYRVPKQANTKKRDSPPTTVRLYWDGYAVDAGGRELANPPLVQLTLAWLARHYYHAPHLAQRLGQANSLGNWGATDPLIKHPRFKKLKKGAFNKIRIPAEANLPRAHNSSAHGVSKG